MQNSWRWKLSWILVSWMACTRLIASNSDLSDACKIATIGKGFRFLVAKVESLGRKAQTQTNTINLRGKIVPWPSANGPACYHPTQLPQTREKDMFDYQTFMGGAFSQAPSRFGGQPNSRLPENIGVLWGNYGAQNVTLVHTYLGERTESGFNAPMGVFKIGPSSQMTSQLTQSGASPSSSATSQPTNKSIYYLIQNGSIQALAGSDQPEIEDGYIYLMQSGTLGDACAVGWTLLPEDSDLVNAYFDVMYLSFTNSASAFTFANNGASARSTHIAFNRLYSREGLGELFSPPIQGPLLQLLLSKRGEFFSLHPHSNTSPRVKVKTPLSNIRITSFFDDRARVLVIDPSLIEIVSGDYSPPTFQVTSK